MHQTLNQLTAFAQDDPDIAILWLYGSRAKGTHEASSDYDLAVAFNERLSDPLDSRLRPEILAMDWAEKLNMGSAQLTIVDINKTPIPLALATVTQGRVLHCKDALRLAREENRITSIWELDYLYHQKHFTNTSSEAKNHG